MSEGLPYALAADRLGISESTVKRHAEEMYRALNVHSILQAVQAGFKLGLLDYNDWIKKKLQ